MKKQVVLCIACGVLLSSVPLSSCSSKKGTKYRIDAEYFPEEQKLVARMEAEIVNPTELPLPALKFELYPNAYRAGAKYCPVGEPFVEEAYYHGESYGGISISSVEGGTFTVGGEDENILTVTLPEELYPDETAKISISFETTLATIGHRLGVGEHAVNLANFYPVLCPLNEGGFSELIYTPNGDPFVSACADYDVTLRVPSEYEVFDAEKTENGYSLHAENVRDVAFVLAKDYAVEETEANGVLVKYCHPRERRSEIALNAAVSSLNFYSDTFLKYAYPDYWVVETDLPYGGMEYPRLSLISLDLQEEEKPSVIAHETAHQWWYAMVGSDQFNEAWQDEGLAEYSVALLAKEDPTFGEYDKLVSSSERAYRTFFSVYSQVCGGADTRMSRPLTAYSGLYEYRSIAYDKGVVLFDRVRLVAGEEKVRRALSMYAEKYEGKIASRADMVACFSAAGAHAKELFDSFADGKCVI